MACPRQLLASVHEGIDLLLGYADRDVAEDFFLTLCEGGGARGALSGESNAALVDDEMLLHVG